MLFLARRFSVLQLLVTTNVVPSSPILVTLMMEAIHSSGTSVLTRATRRHIQEDGIPLRAIPFLVESRSIFRYIDKNINPGMVAVCCRSWDLKRFRFLVTVFDLERVYRPLSMKFRDSLYKFSAIPGKFVSVVFTGSVSELYGQRL
jgi:hypothetical protein